MLASRASARISFSRAFLHFHIYLSLFSPLSHPVILSLLLPALLLANLFSRSHVSLPGPAPYFPCGNCCSYSLIVMPSTNRLGSRVTQCSTLASILFNLPLRPCSINRAFTWFRSLSSTPAQLLVSVAQALLFMAKCRYYFRTISRISGELSLRTTVTLWKYYKGAGLPAQHDVVGSSHGVRFRGVSLEAFADLHN
jgi:hypothetical protein